MRQFQGAALLLLEAAPVKMGGATANSLPAGSFLPNRNLSSLAHPCHEIYPLRSTWLTRGKRFADFVILRNSNHISHSRPAPRRAQDTPGVKRGKMK